MSVVTRFAPSPTGYLHIGGARTALFNFLFSKINKGKFLLRIEDTDRERWSKEAETAIFEGLSWLGIEPDIEPISQYSRKNRHLEVAAEMVNKGTAYRCYLSQEEYRARKEKFEKNNPGKKFLSPWRDSFSIENKPFVVRIKAPSSGFTIISDIIQGEIVWNNNVLDDFVLVRSNNDPTYMLSVVVDDYDMEISHVIRGDDHLTNAARQSLIFEANNWKLPNFAHIPLLHGSDGTKLSKRHGALGIESYKQEGYPNKAVINYLLSLGWSYPETEIFTLNDAISHFDLKKLNKSPSRFDKDKLLHLSSTYIKNSTAKELEEWLNEWALSVNRQDFDQKVLNIISDRLGFFKSRAKTLIDILEDSFFIHCQKNELYQKQNLFKLTRNQITLVKKYLRQLPSGNWNRDLLLSNLNLFTKHNNMPVKEIGIPLRIILTGSKNSPGIIDILMLLGEDASISRITDYLARHNN